MLPMPPHILDIQSNYASLINEVKEIIGDLGITPQSALMMAFIGEEKITICTMVVRQYLIGTNPNYTLQRLESSGFLVMADNSADRRKRTISLTPKGIALSDKIRSKLKMNIQKRAA